MLSSINPKIQAVVLRMWLGRLSLQHTGTPSMKDRGCYVSVFIGEELRDAKR